MDFPNPCTRCGFCCLAEACPVARLRYGLALHDACPALSFDEQGQASCALLEQYPAECLGVGKGCCVKARVVARGVTLNFADMPPEMKRAAVAAIVEGRVPCHATR